MKFADRNYSYKKKLKSSAGYGVPSQSSLVLIPALLTVKALV